MIGDLQSIGRAERLDDETQRLRDAESEDILGIDDIGDLPGLQQGCSAGFGRHGDHNKALPRKPASGRFSIDIPTKLVLKIWDQQVYGYLLVAVNHSPGHASTIGSGQEKSGQKECGNVVPRAVHDGVAVPCCSLCPSTVLLVLATTTSY